LQEATVENSWIASFFSFLLWKTPIFIAKISHVWRCIMQESKDTINAIWIKVLSTIENTLNDPTMFDNYLADLTLASLSKNIAVIITPDEVTKTIVEAKYSQTIISALSSVTETTYSLKFYTADDFENRKEELEEKNETPFFVHSKLKQNLTFENFIVGKSNEEAYKSAIYVCEDKDRLFNPLFIYSKSGLGKTHLLNAIGNAFLINNPRKKVLYITAEDFVDEYVKFTNSKDKQKNNLKDFFRNVDLLLIDDIQFFADKQKTCEMFFYVFNALVNADKQIVLTSDRSPSDLEGFEDRLVTRFSSGLTVSIKPLELDTLVEILRLKINANKYDPSLFSDDVLYYLASKFGKNVRELEGALSRICFYNILKKNVGPITMDIVHEAFDEKDEKSKKNAVTPEKVIAATANYYSLAPSQITSSVRKYQICLARQIVIYICSTFLNMTCTEIGKVVNRDHSTVTTTVQKVQDLLKTDPQIKKAIEAIRKVLKV